MVTATVSAKGWIVIPAKERREFGIAPGTKVIIRKDGDALRISPATPDPIAQAYGMLSGEKSLSTALLKEHEKEMIREEKRLLTWR
ncbi:MAG: AbrB/MazE/SpoVT family DNA-binding domain-containing protein [Kiritimatiellae bacterium]|nr:AbrB/MazE/SpoVT family DNA-binding domain-containing protein [Kiritimatiellia bacterium]MDD3544760.1 AbrB/MazE/SpoVT family DNA-binding domain-containing protein [Kiritimatiellia bacterium]MDD4623620.1 AbrB/MazE/SpoVT family DNA-binding domain-containing protein [Kiritimatiellia bacterium]